MKKLSYLLLGCLFLLACEKQETGPEVNFELENIALTGTEAEFRGKFRLSANTYGVQMEEFGAVLTEREANASRTFLLSEFKQTSAEQVFLVDGLSIGKSYDISLYTRAEGEEWKSESFAFTTAQPQVHSISSLSAPVGDVLLIKGSNLPLNLEAVSVRFGEVPAKVLKGGMDSLQVEVPVMDFQPRSITVSFDSYSHTFEEPFVRNAWKEYKFSANRSDCKYLFTLEGKVYFAVIKYHWNSKGHLWMFDPELNSFIQKGDMPHQATRLLSAAVNEKGYALFPRTSSDEYNDLYEYNPETDSWNVKEHLEAPLRWLYSSLYERNGLLYFMGGYNSDSQQLAYNDFYSYDLQNDLYDELPPVNFSISGPFFEHQGIQYAIMKEEGKIIGFNEGQLSWDELFICPEEVENPVFLPYKDRVYVFSFVQQKTWTYNLTNSTWQEEASPFAPPANASSLTSFTVGNKGYLGLDVTAAQPILFEFYPE